MSTAPPSSLTTVDIDNMRASLAAELASRLLPLQQVLDSHGITKSDLKTLLRDPQFKHQIVEFRKIWNSPMSAAQRVKVKAAIAVEDGLIELDTLFHDRTLNPTARIDAFKQLIALSDTAPKREAGAAGNTFSLNISLSGDGDGQRQELVIGAGTGEAEEAAVPEDQGN